MIEVDGLEFTYPGAEFRLRVPGLRVEAGERLAIIGPSGSGKTTLLNLVAGILRPQRGRVNVDGVEVSALGDAERRDFRITRIGFVFQDFELLDYLDVLDNILHPYRITRALKLDPEARRRARALARELGIEHHLRRPVTHLSQGEKQRAAISRALLPGPKLILADEATGNLDPRNKGHILDLLFRSQEAQGASLLAVTHDHELLPRFDRVLDFEDFPGLIDSLYIAWRYLAYHKARSLTLVACVALIGALPLALELLLAESQRQLLSRADSTPLLVGAKGSALDLAMNSLYFSDPVPELISMAEAEAVDESGLALPVPLYVRFRARGHPIVGTSLDYFEFRGLRLAAGQGLTLLGDCVLGAEVASGLGLAPGDAILSSPETLFDLAGVYPLRMRVAGVLAPSGSADDRAVFVDVKTAWVIQGLVHGHQDLSDETDPTLVMGRKGGKVTASPKLAHYTEITPDNLASFHFHGDPADYPLSAVLVLPLDERSGTLLRGRYIGDGVNQQILRPREVIDGLMQNIFRIKRVLDAVILLVGSATLLALVLVFALSLRLRQRELQTIFRLGCSRATIVRLLGAEILLILIAATALSALVLLVLQGQQAALVRHFFL